MSSQDIPITKCVVFNLVLIFTDYKIFQLYVSRKSKQTNILKVLTNHVLVTPLPDPSSYWCPVWAFLMSSETNNRGMVRAKISKDYSQRLFFSVYVIMNVIIYFSKTSFLVYIISMWYGIPKDWFSCLCYNECDMIFSKTSFSCLQWMR